MGLSADQLRASLDSLAAIEPGLARTIRDFGYPAPRIRPLGYATLLRTIIGQQVSVRAADTVWERLANRLGDIEDPASVLAASDETLRGAGLSRQKNAYARSLAGLIRSGALDLDALSEDDEEAIAALTAIRGIGRWSAEIYLLFAEGRPDIWPAGDLAIRIAVGQMLAMDDRPSEQAVRDVAERWKPHRGAAAILAWHRYNSKVI